MKLHNTLARQVMEVSPMDGQTYRVYSCGPTVYDSIHIGNLGAFIAADTLRRALALGGKPVKHVMNLTDVDDKTIARSRQRYPDLEPMEALKRLTTEYADIFFADMKAVGNDTEAVIFVRATDNIDAMQDLIRQLRQGDFAYAADDGIYFSIRAYEASGKVYGQLSPVTASSTAAPRIQNDEYDKASAQDFALWKTQKPGEPAWDFELDGRDFRGRPGWHIECSVMSTGNLGQPFDIHTGGVDLIFPHHENEIAQSTAGKTDPVYARVFVHNEHILVDGKKMSKSLNNFYTLKDIVGKGYDPLAFRLLVLQSHYRSQAHFSFDNLEAAQNRLKALRNVAELRYQVANRADDAQQAFIDQSTRQIQDEIANDLNTPAALETIALAADEFERHGVTSAATEHFNKWLQTIDNLLGLQLLDSTPDISPEQKHLIADRESARQAKDWDKADQLRKQLEDQGIGLRDTPNGAVWFRK